MWTWAAQNSYELTVSIYMQRLQKHQLGAALLLLVFHLNHPSKCMTSKDTFPGLSRSWNFPETNPGLSRRRGNPGRRTHNWKTFLYYEQSNYSVPALLQRCRVLSNMLTMWQNDTQSTKCVIYSCDSEHHYVTSRHNNYNVVSILLVSNCFFTGLTVCNSRALQCGVHFWLLLMLLTDIMSHCQKFLHRALQSCSLISTSLYYW